MRRVEGLQVNFGRERVVAARIFQRVLRDCLGGRARWRGWWEDVWVTKARRRRVFGPGSVAPTRTAKSRTKNYRKLLGFLLHTKRCLPDVGVVFFRSSGKRTCRIFLKSHGHAKLARNQTAWAGGLPALRRICPFPRLVSSCSRPLTASYGGTDTPSSHLYSCAVAYSGRGKSDRTGFLRLARKVDGALGNNWTPPAGLPRHSS